MTERQSVEDVAFFASVARCLLRSHEAERASGLRTPVDQAHKSVKRQGQVELVWMSDEPDDEVASGRQRIDKWLWFTRVIKSRTLAAALVAEGRVRLNRERIEKVSQQVKAGDVVTVAVGGHVRVLEVIAPGERRGPATEAQALYRDRTPPRVAPKPEEAVVAERDAGSGRPTKKERREMEKWREGE